MAAFIKNRTNGCSSAAIWRSYGKMPLVQLACAIADRNDHDALWELHENRRVFRSQSGRYVRMAEFLPELKDYDLTFQWCGRDPVVVDQAYDLALAKFHDLPPNSHKTQVAATPEGPDCRYYYRAFLDHITRQFQERPPASAIDEELRAADAFQRMVTRHFYLSCLEARRRAAKLVRRYTWKINGDRLVVWLPIEMRGRRCRAWLRQNIPDPDPARPGERDRVQALIDRLLTRRRILSLEQLRETGGWAGTDAETEPLMYAEEISTVGLAGAVAEEKAENIDKQRPAIRALGEDRLKELIRTVFEALAEGQYHAQRIAGQFSVSNASVSRFAGCRWNRDRGGTADVNRIPDLWVNTAHVLASHDHFAAIAQQAGVWNRVCQVAAAEGRKGEAK